MIDDAAVEDSVTAASSPATVMDSLSWPPLSTSPSAVEVTILLLPSDCKDIEDIPTLPSPIPSVMPPSPPPPRPGAPVMVRVRDVVSDTYSVCVYQGRLCRRGWLPNPDQAVYSCPEGCGVYCLLLHVMMHLEEAHCQPQPGLGASTSSRSEWSRRDWLWSCLVTGRFLSPH